MRRLLRGPLADLLALFAALGLVPLTPVLALTHAEAPWEGVALGGTWAASWYLWLAAQVRGKPT